MLYVIGTVMITVRYNDYGIMVDDTDLPSIYGQYRKHAVLSDEFDMMYGDSDGDICFVGIRKGRQWPSLVVAQKYYPGIESGFHPEVLLVPDTDILFIGAGTRLLAYDMVKNIRLWEDFTDAGFWGWARHKDVIVMSAELEIAAWDTRGRKLWSAWAEPPWYYQVEDGMVLLDIMDTKSRFPLESGPHIR